MQAAFKQRWKVCLALLIVALVFVLVNAVFSETGYFCARFTFNTVLRILMNLVGGVVVLGSVALSLRFAYQGRRYASVVFSSIFGIVMLALAVSSFWQVLPYVSFRNSEGIKGLISLVGSVCIALIAILECRRARIKAASPDENLVFAVFRGRLRLVEPLEGAVMALVEFPRLYDGQPLAIHFLENVVKGMDRSLEIGGVGDVEIVAFLLQEDARLLRFFMSLFGKIDVRPPGEQIELVPFALAMSDQNQLHHDVKYSFPQRVEERSRAANATPKKH